MFALQTTVFIIKIIHSNDMVRHTSLQYQADIFSFVQLKIESGSLEHNIYKWLCRSYGKNKVGSY